MIGTDVPTYKFINNSTGVEWEEFMGIAESEEFLKDNPDVEKLVNGAPMIVGSAMGVSKTKPDNGFRDLLKDMKKANSRGLSKSTINTF
jgi:hypothetical protein